MISLLSFCRWIDATQEFNSVSNKRNYKLEYSKSTASALLFPLM